MTRRTQRLNELIREEISDILRRQVKDPRLGCFLSVTHVDTSSDLSSAKVFVSIMGSEEEKVSTLEGLTAAAPFLRRELNSRVTLRRIPELSFRRDDSLEQGSRVLDLLKQIGDDTDNP